MWGPGVLVSALIAVLPARADGLATRTVASRSSGIGGGVVSERISVSFNPLPIVVGLEKNVASIGQLLQKEKPSRDRLVLRCLGEKLKQAVQHRETVVALIPGLAELTAGPGGGNDSLAAKVANLRVELNQEGNKTLLVAARNVEKLAAEARMCQHITDGLVPAFGASLALQDSALAPDDTLATLPNYSDLPPEDVMAPVSEIHIGSR